MLAMVVNENTGCLIPRGVCAAIASMLGCAGPFLRLAGGSCRSEHARDGRQRKHWLSDSPRCLCRHREHARLRWAIPAFGRRVL